MSTEIELKLRIAPKDIEQFLRRPLLQSATGTSQQLYNTYFDTTEHALLQQGVGLRVRRIGDKRLQTLKTAGSGKSGLHQRQEWEVEITGDTPDYAQFPKGALPDWCADKNHLEQIEVLFITDFNRTTWNLLVDGSNIEVALDQGIVKTETASCPISEIELELKSGEAAQLYQVALDLQEDLPLLIQNKSKAALGYALHQPKPPQFHKAGVVKLTPDMTAEQAYIFIIGHSLGQLQANEDMVLYGEDIEGVHQMRVALRRLRSCLNLYEPLIPKKTYSKCRGELKWITGVLGVARDWDVFALSLQQMQAQSQKYPINLKGANQLQKPVADKQAAAYIAVREALRSPRYSRMLLSLGKWLTQRHWRQNLEAEALQRLDAPVIEFASQILESHYQGVKRENFAELDSEQLHQLRISIKKLAYGCRFFAKLYPSQLVSPYSKNLSCLQDELGIINDTNVATYLLNQIELDKNAPRHFLIGWYTHQQATHYAALEKTWETFIEQKIFW